MGKAFRTALFGGFRKKDVIAYLERLSGPAGFDGTLQGVEAEEPDRAAEQAERMQELANELAAREETCCELQSALAGTQDELEGIRPRLQHSEERAAALENRTRELEEALEEALQGVRARLAELEEERAARQNAQQAALASAQRVQQLEAELSEQKRRCEELMEQRWNAMEKQRQESCRVPCESEHRAQELTLAIRCEGAQREERNESLQRADSLLEELRQELKCVAAEVELLTQVMAADRGCAQESRKLSSLNEILARVAAPKGGRRPE